MVMFDWESASDDAAGNRWFADNVHLTATGRSEFALFVHDRLLPLVGGTSARTVVPGSPLHVPVLNRFGVPASGVKGVALNVTAVNPAGAGWLRVWPCGSPEPSTSSVNYAFAGAVEPNAVVVPVDSTGEVCVGTMTPTEVVVDVSGWFSSGLESAAGRLVDTRDDGPARSVVPGSPLHVAVLNRFGVPASGVKGVALNVTAVNPAGAGWLRVWPCGSPEPSTSSVNYAFAGAVEPNAVVVPVDSTGEVCVGTMTPTEVVVDVSGWFSSGLESAAGRLVDTRDDGPARSVVPGSPLHVPVLNRFGVPASGVKGVALNVTAVNPADAGWLRVWPCGSPEPSTSSVNYAFAGAVEPNAVVVPVDATGEVCVGTMTPTEVVVDVSGWFSSGLESAAGRLVDTRDDGPARSVVPGSPLHVPVLNRFGVPVSNVKGVALNVTAVNPADAGWLRVWPCGSPEPSTSSVNYAFAGAVEPNAVVVPVDATGEVCVGTMTPTEVVVDVSGWFSSGLESAAGRLVDTRDDGPARSVVPGSPLHVAVLNRFGVPASGVKGVALNVTAVNPADAGWLRVWPCGSPEPSTSSVNYAFAGAVEPNAVVVPVDATGEVCVGTMTPTEVVVDVSGWFSSGLESAAGRLVDTRDDGPARSVVPGSPLHVAVLNRFGVPASGVKGVALNVTAVNPADAGWLRVWPCGSPEPSTSSVNYAFAGAVEPNAVVVPVDATGEVCVGTMTPTEVVVDVSGWFSSGLESAAGRLVDTRDDGPARSVVPGSPLHVAVLNRFGVPASGVKGVALNVTAVNPADAGWLRVWPCGSPEPSTSSVNYAFAGAVEPNAVVVPVDATGEVCVGTMTPTEVVVDVSGWFSSGLESAAGRLVDTRDDGPARSVVPGSPLHVAVLNRFGVPASGVKGVALNVTAV